jgi:hypothetical protein
MNRNNSRARSTFRANNLRADPPDEVHHLLRFEKEILQSISAGNLLADVLNQICSALDCQIGNVVSVIAPAGNYACDFAAIAAKAELFGLSVFCSEKILAENNVLLGSLDMYCIFPRTPSPAQFPLIERAKCLAILAIKISAAAQGQNIPRSAENHPTLGGLLEWPLSPN